MTPALPPGHVEVEITNNGQEWTADRVPFRSLARVFVRNLAPAIGPVHGGTRVEVHGSGFVFNGNLRCMFGFEEVPASFVSSSPSRELSLRSRSGTRITGPEARLDNVVPLLTEAARPPAGPIELGDAFAIDPSELVGCRIRS